MSEAMDSKIKAQSSPGTPLTVKWVVGSTESTAPETESSANRGRFGVLILGFAIGLSVFGLISWFLSHRFWLVDALLGGYLSCLWVQRLGEKRFGWRKAATSEDTGVLSVSEIKKRRLAYALPGMVIGFGAIVLTALLTGVSNWILDAAMAGLGGYEAATGLGERFRGLPTLNDLALVRLREGMSPLDLKSDDRVPVTLKTDKEVKATR
jgi:hypothetical protein